MMMRWTILVFGLLLSGCALPPPPSAPSPSAPTETGDPGRNASRAEVARRAEQAADNFFTVIRRVEPVAEAECRARTVNVNCDYLLVIDDRVTSPPNAFQTLDASGRPVVGFTIALIAEARNRDELAFILGHEAAHHIKGHLARSQASAQSGAMLAGVLASLGGADTDTVRRAQSFGAEIGARRYSKGFELEADALGTIIAARAGFDPVHGAEYFARVPDPGNQFLGTHPPNADRIAVVRQAAAGL